MTARAGAVVVSCDSCGASATGRDHDTVPTVRQQLHASGWVTHRLPDTGEERDLCPPCRTELIVVTPT